MHFFIFKGESNEFKGECIDFKKGCTSLLGGSSILKGVGNRFIGGFFRVNGFRRYSRMMDLGLAVYRFRVHSNRL